MIRTWSILTLTLICLLALGCAERRIHHNQPQTDGAAHRVDGGVVKQDSRCVQPPGGCYSNNDCPSGQVCKGCGADPCCPMCAVCYGKCEPADGCSQLMQTYVDTLEQARKCTVADGPRGPQCTRKVDDKLACPCPTFVNPANQGGVNKLASLKQQWKAKKCDAAMGACPPVACAPLAGASCKANGPGDPRGECKDQYK